MIFKKLDFSLKLIDNLPSLIDLYDTVFMKVQKDQFMYTIFSNTKICLTNNSILHIYEGITEYIKQIVYNDTFIYILCTDWSLYRTFYTNLDYKLINKNVNMFSVDKEDNILYLDLSGRLILNNKILQDNQFNIKYIKLINNIPFLVRDNICTYKDTVLNIKEVVGDILITKKGLYDVSRMAFFKIKNIEKVEKIMEDIYITKKGKIYKIEI